MTAANGVEDKKTQEVKNKVDTGAVDEIACFLTKECPREFNAFYRVHNRLQSPPKCENGCESNAPIRKVKFKKFDKAAIVNIVHP